MKKDYTPSRRDLRDIRMSDSYIRYSKVDKDSFDAERENYLGRLRRSKTGRRMAERTLDGGFSPSKGINSHARYAASMQFLAEDDSRLDNEVLSFLEAA